MATSKMKLREQQRSTVSKASKAMSAEVSPDSKCPICLDIFNNISYLDICLHKFCFRCIHEWSKNKAECPLCKQPFNSIYHSIKSDQDFKKYDLRPLDNGSFGSFGGERFRYRTTVTGVHRQAQRRTSPPPDNGVLFEGVADRAPRRQDRALRRIMQKFALRMTATNEGREMRALQEQEMITFRRELYRRGVRVRNVRDGGRSRDTAAEFYQRNPACLHRLVPWLKRELTVLYGAHGSLVNIVQHIIMSRITHYDMEDRSIQEELRPFLQGRTEHFLHEFISFAKSPYNMEAYDRHAVYDCPAPSSNEDSSSNSSVIAISEDEQDSVEIDPPGDSVSSGVLSQSAWDDETPGPSYSTTSDRSRVQQLSVPDSESDSSVEDQIIQDDRVSPQHRSPDGKMDSPQETMDNDGWLPSEEDDCVIVGFIKPVAERTPELVQLSSDSEESVHEVTHLPQHIRFASVSPPASHDSDLGSAEPERARKDFSRSRSKDRGSPCASSRHKSSSRNKRSRHDKDVRRRHNGDRSRERQRSRSRDRSRRKNTDQSRSTKSPVNLNSDGTFSKGRRHSRSRSRDRSHSRWETGYKWPSRSHHSWDKDSSGTHHSDRRSYHNSCSKNPDQHFRSRSRSCSQESRSRKQSRSRSYSSNSSPSTKKKSRHDKPGGKRKYKTRHLEEPSKSSSSKSHVEHDSSLSCTKDKKSKEKHRKKSKDKSGKRSRSLSVEIVYEGSSSEQTRKHHKKKKKHKKKSKRRKSKERTEKHSPSVITIDSDSDDSAKNTVTPASSIKKDNPVKSTSAHCPPLDSILQEWENQIPPVCMDNDNSKTCSSHVTDIVANRVEQCDAPHCEGDQALNNEGNCHSPLNANTSVSDHSS